MFPSCPDLTSESIHAPDSLCQTHNQHGQALLLGLTSHGPSDTLACTSQGWASTRADLTSHPGDPAACTPTVAVNLWSSHYALSLGGCGQAELSQILKLSPKLQAPVQASPRALGNSSLYPTRNPKEPLHGCRILTQSSSGLRNQLVEGAPKGLSLWDEYLN